MTQQAAPTPVSAMSLGPEICGSLEEGGRREWLETNGLGGFASSTIVGMNTRRYHGLLVAATRPPTGRVVALSKLEETLVVDGRRFDLSTNEYEGAIYPEGYRFLTAFRLDPYPIWTFDCEGLVLERSLCMIHDENTIVIRYSLNSQLSAPNSQLPVQLELRPLIAFRDYHALTHENGALNPRVYHTPLSVGFQPYEGLPMLTLEYSDAVRDNAHYWYRGFEYARERDRGLDFREDLYSPLALTFNLTADPNISIIASTERRQKGSADEIVAHEVARRETLVAGAPPDPLARRLFSAAGQFIVQRGTGKSIIAGYPWFTDWSRDTMIALPGLALTTGRPEIARSLLLNFSLYADRGMLPNRFPDKGEEPEYNTVDGTLWYFAAVDAYLRNTDDRAMVHDCLYPVLANIVEWHLRGTRYGIRVEPDGLVHAGEVGQQLTWMDARVGDWVVTPRAGKPVEIQALWYNALKVLADLAAEQGDAESASRYNTYANRAWRAFDAQFWNEDAGCFYDVVNGDERDGSIRPNQLFALSLRHTMVGKERALRALAVVERDLLTPVGMRTLAPSDTRYRPSYYGDIFSRDGAYHQGTVWPWLMAPYFEALKRYAGEAAARRESRQWLHAYAGRLSELCVGQAPEVYDGDPPHRPGGCPAQAWSVAALLDIFTA